MQPYCPRCFRDLATDDAECLRCTTSPASRWVMLVGLLALIVVIVGTMTLNVTLCVSGAAIGMATLVTHVIQRF